MCRYTSAQKAHLHINFPTFLCFETHASCWWEIPPTGVNNRTLINKDSLKVVITELTGLKMLFFLPTPPPFSEMHQDNKRAILGCRVSFLVIKCKALRLWWSWWCFLPVEMFLHCANNGGKSAVKELHWAVCLNPERGDPWAGDVYRLPVMTVPLSKAFNSRLLQGDCLYN